MKSTVEQLSPTRVRINVEVPFDELKPQFDRAYKQLAKQVRIPGFRPGKAPARILEARVGRGAVLDEVVNEAIPAKYLEAVNAGEIKTLGRPEIEVTKLEDNELLGFKAEVDIRPEITVPGFDTLASTVDDIEITDDEVAQQLDELRARFGTLVGVDREIADGDFVVLDLSATVDGADVEEARTSGLSYQIGSGELVDGIDEALVGCAKDETKVFTASLVAGEFAGKDAEVTAVVKAVKERQLPELDDEFAQLASEFDTLDALKDDVRQRVSRAKRMQQGVQARDKVLAALLDGVDVPLPEAVVDAEVEVRKHDAVHAFDHDDAKFNEWLSGQGQTMEQFDDEIRRNAREAVKTQLVLDTVADSQSISVSDGELIDRVVYQAQRFGVSPDEYVRRAQESGQLGAIYADLRRGKALAWLVSQTTITDASGNTLDLSEIFGQAAPAKAEESPEDAPAAVNA